jgi:hypothetical protein
MVPPVLRLLLAALPSATNEYDVRLLDFAFQSVIIISAGRRLAWSILVGNLLLLNW